MLDRGEAVEREDKVPELYKRYVVKCSNCNRFPSSIKRLPSVHKFTIEIATNNKLPLVGIMIKTRGCHLTTGVYRKPPDSRLLLYYQSHVDQRYKRCLLKTMFNREYRLLSSWKLFTNECEKLKRIFVNLKYAENLISFTIATFLNSVILSDQSPAKADTQANKMVRIASPFKDQNSADVVRKQLKDENRKRHTTSVKKSKSQ